MTTETATHRPPEIGYVGSSRQTCRCDCHVDSDKRMMFPCFGPAYMRRASKEVCGEGDSLRLGKETYCVCVVCGHACNDGWMSKTCKPNLCTYSEGVKCGFGCVCEHCKGRE